MANKNIKIMQVKSAIRKPKKQKQWLLNLGLKKLNKVKEIEDNPSNRGIINKISHLLKVVE